MIEEGRNECLGPIEGATEENLTVINKNSMSRFPVYLQLSKDGLVYIRNKQEYSALWCEEN